MTGHVGYHHLLAAPAARPGQLGENPDRHAPRGLREDALGARQQAHRLHDLLLGDRLHHPARLPRDADHVGAVRGAADRYGAGDGVRPHGLHPLGALAPGVVDGGASQGLRPGEAGQPERRGHEVEVDELLDRPAVADELAARGDRDHDLVREPPAQLLGGLEGQRLRPLRVERPDVDVAEGPGVLLHELAAEPVDVVVAAPDGDDVGLEDAGRQELAVLRVVGDEHEALEPGPGGVGGNRVGQVPGRGAADRLEPVRPGPGDRHRDHAVLERVGRVHAVVLEVEVAQAQLGAQAVRPHQGREPLSQRDQRRLVLDGQEVPVAPHAGWPRLDPAPVDDAPYRLVVIGDVERAEAGFADVRRPQLVLRPTLPTPEPEHPGHPNQFRCSGGRSRRPGPSPGGAASIY